MSRTATVTVGDPRSMASHGLLVTDEDSGNAVSMASHGLLVVVVIPAQTFVRPVGIVVGMAVPGEQFQYVAFGTRAVHLESESLSPGVGDAAWLSSSKAGRVTNVMPSGTRFLVGQFLSTKDPVTKKCNVALAIDIKGAV